MITINLGSDVLKFDKSIAPDPNDVDPSTHRHRADGSRQSQRTNQRRAAVANAL